MSRTVARLVARRARDFIAREERGVAAIEFAIIVPVVVMLLIGTATYFLIGREDYRSKRATYTAGDIVARQKSVTDAFLGNVKAMSERIATTDARTIGLRVTSATRVGALWVVSWSYATSPFTKRTLLDGVALSAPEMATGESLIIVETSVPYRPLFSAYGSTTRQHVNVSFARPRNVSVVLKTD